MWATWFCHGKRSVPVKVGDQDQYDEWTWAPSGRISKEDKLSPPSCLSDGNSFSLSHLWWPTCVCHSGCQTNHKRHLGSIWSIHPVFQVRSHFTFVCSPYYFLWLSKISITWDSGTENGLWTPEVYILFYFYSFLWWLHYSLMPEFFPKLSPPRNLFLSSASSSLACPFIESSCMEVTWCQGLGFVLQNSKGLPDFWIS